MLDHTVGLFSLRKKLPKLYVLSICSAILVTIPLAQLILKTMSFGLRSSGVIAERNFEDL